MTLKVEAAGITHRGTVRERNEDCIAIAHWISQETMDVSLRFEYELDLPFACVVCDGMGGHNDGDKASLLVAKSLARRLPAHSPDKIGSSVRAVNAELYSELEKNPALAGMGSTAVGIAIHGRSLTVFNVGDSRAYKVLEKGLAQLSTDDTLSSGWKPGSSGGRSTRLLQCFGGQPTFTDVTPHLHTEPSVAGNTYLCCSDGLYETLPEERMRELIGEDLAKSADALMHAALEAKARDNVTVALVRING